MAGFLDNVLNNLNKGIESVSNNSKTMMEKSKLNGNIKTIEAEKKMAFEAIGMSLYNFMLNTTEGDFPREEALNLCAQIAEKDNMINDIKARIAELDADNAPKAEVPVQEGPQPVVCSCGFTNAPGAVFCARCGNKIG